MPEKYPYDYDYQVDILKICVQDPQFLKLHPDVIQPRFFNLDHLMTVAQLIMGFFEKYQESPTPVQLRQEAATYFAQYTVRAELQQNILAIVERLYTEGVRNGQAIQDSATDFARRQAMVSGCLEILDLTEKGGDLDKAVEIMRQSAVVGRRQREGLSFFKTVPDLNKLILSDRGYNSAFRIGTGLRKIDRATHGGIGPGHIWVVAAKPKGGKTTLMVNIGAHALYSGKRVYHYSFGDMNKTDVMLKYTQRVSGMTLEQIMQEYDYRTRCEQLLQMNPEVALEIVYESPGVMDAQDLYTDLGYRISKTGIKPDLVIVDYANKMKQKSIDNSYRSMSIIYEGLKELGDAYNCGVLTGVQLRRDAKRDDGSPEDIAESWLQVADCDALLIINQNEQEAANNRARISMPIVRRGKEVMNLQVEFHKEVARFRDM